MRNLSDPFSYSRLQNALEQIAVCSSKMAHQMQILKREENPEDLMKLADCIEFIQALYGISEGISAMVLNSTRPPYIGVISSSRSSDGGASIREALSKQGVAGFSAGGRMPSLPHGKNG